MRNLFKAAAAAAALSLGLLAAACTTTNPDGTPTTAGSIANWFDNAKTDVATAVASIQADLPTVCKAIATGAPIVGAVAGQINSGVGAVVAAGAGTVAAVSKIACAGLTAATTTATTLSARHAAVFRGTSTQRLLIAKDIKVWQSYATVGDARHADAALAKLKADAAAAGIATP